MANQQRVSLSKTQRQAGVGAELLSLCQSITEDGSISKEEILALRAWLKANKDSDLPAIEFLTKTVEKIIADRVVTKEERKELYQAIEKVLPPDVRKGAAEQRRAVEAAQRERDRAKREADKQDAQEERKRKSPLATADFMVAGVHAEGRPEVIRQHLLCSDDDRAYLIRDRQNRYSRNAIEVRIGNGMQIGYVPEDDAVDLAPLLDQGYPHQAYVKKVLTGGRIPIPVVVARVYRPDAEVEDLVFERAVPEKPFHAVPRQTKRARESGCLSVIVAGFLTAAIFALL